MAHTLIANLQEGDELHQFFVVRQAEQRLTRSGDPFLALSLGDRSGTLKAKVWADVLAKSPGPFQAGDYVGVTGRVTSFNDELQLTVQFIMTLDRLRQLKKEPLEFDQALLHPCTAYDPHLMWQELLSLAADNLTGPLRELVLHLLNDNAAAFQQATAARRNHHAYVGGLLEHTWFVARLAHRLAGLYPEINAELTLAGAILHDIGKIREIMNPLAPDFSVPGQLLGHIVLGFAMIRQQAEAMAFPDANLLLQLEHIIIAHHGYQEFGSPVLPKTREALMVYYLDDLDAKLKMMEQHLAADSSSREFTTYHRLLQRELYKAAEEPVPSPGLPPDQEN